MTTVRESGIQVATKLMTVCTSYRLLVVITTQYGGAAMMMMILLRANSDSDDDDDDGSTRTQQCSVGAITVSATTVTITVA